MAETLPFTLLPPEEGKVRLLAIPEPRFLNLTNTVHGGRIMMMLDAAMSLAAQTTLSPGEAPRTRHVDMPDRAREAVMSTLSITNPPPSERRLTGGFLFLLAGLAVLGALATNINLPAFPQIGASLGGSSQELGLTLPSFFVAFAFGQLLAGPISDRFGRKWLVLGGLAVFPVPPGIRGR